MEMHYDHYGNIKMIISKCQFSVDVWPLNRKIFTVDKENIYIEGCDVKVN